MAGSASPPSPGRAESAASRHVLVHGVVGALCPLIPIPFVDDIALAFVRRQMLKGVFAAHGHAVSETRLKVLTEGPRRSLLSGCFFLLVKYPFKKIFRKVFYFLSVKDAVDAASSVIHEGLLVDHALVTGQVDAGWLAADDGRWRQLNLAVRSTCAKVDTRPLNQVLRSSLLAGREAMSRAALSIARAIGFGRGRPSAATVESGLDRADVDADPQVQRMAAELGRHVFSQPGYLDALFRLFDGVLRETLAAPPPEQA